MTSQQPKLSVQPTIQMAALLEDKSLCKIIARAYPEFQKVLQQTQLDVVNEVNRDTVGPTLLGMKHIQDILSVFKAKGDVYIQQEPKQ
jgi:hypothetical protein